MTPNHRERQRGAMNSFIMPLLLLLLLAAAHHRLAAAATFTCNATATATCQGLAGYVAYNATTLAAIQSLFQVTSLSALLAANSDSLPLSTPSSHRIPANSTVNIPFPCSCSNGIGTSAGTPVYTVSASDSGLDAIARYRFDLFATYQEIAAANGIANPNVITVGQKLRIPLPCSCDPVDGQRVVHLAHIVAAGSSVSAIAAQFGTTEATLLRLNGIADPSTLQAQQVLDVPIKPTGVAAPTPSPAPQPSAGSPPGGGNSQPGGGTSFGSRLEMRGSWIAVLLLLHAALLWFGSLA